MKKSYLKSARWKNKETIEGNFRQQVYSFTAWKFRERNTVDTYGVFMVNSKWERRRDIEDISVKYVDRSCQTRNSLAKDTQPISARNVPVNKRKKREQT